MKTVTGVLGQLDIHRGEVIGVVRRDDDGSVLFIHVPVDVTTGLDDELLVDGTSVALTGHLCDHDTYLVVTRVEAA
jgi:hypothetical protein